MFDSLTVKEQVVKSSLTFNTKMSSRRIAIIGAGASGICAAKHMLEAKGDVQLIPVLFEQKSDIGGLWIYEDVDDTQDNGKNIHSSIYNNVM